MKTIPTQNAGSGVQMFPVAKRRNEGVKTIITTLTNHPRKNRVRRDNYENMVCPAPKIEGFLSAVKIRAFFDYFVEEIAQMMMERSIKQCYCYHASKKSKQTFFFDLNAETKITITIEEK